MQKLIAKRKKERFKHIIKGQTKQAKHKKREVQIMETVFKEVQKSRAQTKIKGPTYLRDY